MENEPATPPEAPPVTENIAESTTAPVVAPVDKPVEKEGEKDPRAEITEDGNFFRVAGLSRDVYFTDRGTAERIAAALYTKSDTAA